MENSPGKPEWFRVSYNEEAISQMNDIISGLSLNTVCKEADCPNLGECYKKKTATFMILGSHCTRHCRFCNVSKGTVDAIDESEPENIAKAVKFLKLRHVVITCVTRDDLSDGGAKHFAKTINAIRKTAPGTTIEVLISDMQGNKENLDFIIHAKPDIINHNIETVEYLYPKVRPEADYRVSLGVLNYVKTVAPKILTKTGIMVGLGEAFADVCKVMDDAIGVNCDAFTIGQYLQPSEQHLPVREYITPQVFDEYRKLGVKKGFRYIASSPLVRSSYHAEDIYKVEDCHDLY